MAQIAGQTGGGAGGAKGADRLDAIQIFAGSQPYGARVVPETSASSASMLLLTSASSY